VVAQYGAEPLALRDDAILTMGLAATATSRVNPQPMAAFDPNPTFRFFENLNVLVNGGPTQWPANSTI
jgi:hypothetical protein